MRPSLLIAALSALSLSLAPAACSRIDPVSGTWVYVNGQTLTNTCGDEGEPSSGNFTVINNDNGTLTIEPEDGSQAFNCTLDGAELDCPDRLQEKIENDAVDAVITVNVRADGVFESDTYVTGTQTLTAACAGSQCALAESLLAISFPCAATVSYTASFKE
jgi:hypothetical protein